MICTKGWKVSECSRASLNQLFYHLWWMAVLLCSPCLSPILASGQPAGGRAGVETEGRGEGPQLSNSRNFPNWFRLNII